MTISLSGLRVTMSDIAQAQNVNRSTVTRWRRTADMPAPISGQRGDQHEDLFNAQRVLEWLVATGRCPAEGETTDLHLGAFAREITLRLPPSERLDVPLHLLGLRARARLPLSDLAARGVVPSAQAWLTSHLDALDEHDVLEALLSRRTMMQVPWLENDPLRPEILRLFAGLVSPLRGGLTVLDPAAGEGDLLVSVLAACTTTRFAASDERPLLVEAQEVEPALLRLLDRRIQALTTRLARPAVDGGSGARRLRALVLAPRPLRAPVGLLIAVLPAGLPALDTIDLLSGLLNKVEPGGQLAVLGSRDALVGDLADEPSVARRRASMLRTNALDIVVHLPRSIRQGPSSRASAILVMRRSTPPGRTVTADLTEVRLDTETVDRCLAEVRDRDGRIVRTLTAVIDQHDLLASDFRLAVSPSGHRQVSPADLLAALDATADLTDAAGRLPLPIPVLSPRPLRRVPVAQLRTGRTPTLEIIDGASSVTLPGDVVVRPGQPLRADADLVGGALVEHPAHIVRITEHGRGTWTPRVLAALLPWRIGQGQASLDAISLACPDAASLAQWDDALGAVGTLRGLLHDHLDTLRCLEQVLVDGLFNGSVLPSPRDLTSSTSDVGDSQFEPSTVGNAPAGSPSRRSRWDR
ncbi:MAG: hypothetical protein QG671_1772 [Actinomycetota bacterium]|nr:hypothetical protein [Actinomycetota bacterium]